MSRDARAGSPSGHLDDKDEDSVDLGQLRHYLHAPLRRPLLVVVPWAVIVILSVLAFLALPKRYKSSTLILVESEKVPDKFVSKMVTDDRGQRLEAILPEILSRTRLERVLQETRPYPEIDSHTQAVERLQRAVTVSLSGNDGFTIEFVHTNPHKAQEVTNRVATLFMEETMNAREQQVEGAVDFLTTQVAEAKKEVEKRDEALRLYKQAHMGALPEQLQTNLATMQMLQQALQTVEESLIFARDKRDALARGSGSRTPAQPGAATELAELQRQLAALRGRYTDAHPDVQSLRSRIARLEARMSANAGGDGADAGEASSAVYREQLERTDDEIKKLETKRADLESRIAAVRGHIEETPRTEQELANLTRDYNKLNDNYVALFTKQLEARMAGRLEQRWKGDQFRMLDPANLPEKPYFPKASIVIGLGLVLGLFVGLGASLVAEYIDSSVKDADDLQAVMSFPVLARIPHLPTLGEPPTR